MRRIVFGNISETGAKVSLLETALLRFGSGKIETYEEKMNNGSTQPRPKPEGSFDFGALSLWTEIKSSLLLILHSTSLLGIQPFCA